MEGLEFVDYFPSELVLQTPIVTDNITYDPPIEYDDTAPGHNGTVISIHNISVPANTIGYVYMTGIMRGYTCEDFNLGYVDGYGMTVEFSADYECGPVPEVVKYQNIGDGQTQEIVNVDIGDSITYYVYFENIGGTGTEGGVTISDYLPQGIGYIGSEIVICDGFGSCDEPTPLFEDQNNVGGQDYIVYSGFDLAAGQTGVMTIYAEISDDLNYDVYENGALLIFNPYYVGTSNIVTGVREDITTVDFEKYITDLSGHNLSTGQTLPYYFQGDEIRFELVVTNLGDEITGVTLDDVWPDLQQTCVRYSGWESNDTRSWEPPFRREDGNLVEGDSVALTLIGEIVGASDCVGTYINTGILYYYQNGTLYTGEDDAWFEIRDTSVLLTKSVDSTDLAPGSLVTYTL